MFRTIFPIFSKGRILKTEMLEELRDYPRDFFKIYFENYANGIIAGTRLQVCADELIVHQGVIKFNGKLYLHLDEYHLPYQQANREMLLKIRFLEQSVENDFLLDQAEIYLDDQTTLHQNELELGRFKLREGAILRTDYTDFHDLATEYNTMNIINVPYACSGASTLSPLVLQFFAKIVLRSNTDSPLDIGFAMQCLNNELVRRDLVSYYVANRLGVPNQSYTNHELYKHLTTIIREIEGGVRRKVENRSRSPRMIVD